MSGLRAVRALQPQVDAEEFSSANEDQAGYSDYYHEGQADEDDIDTIEDEGGDEHEERRGGGTNAEEEPADDEYGESFEQDAVSPKHKPDNSPSASGTLRRRSQQQLSPSHQGQGATATSDDVDVDYESGYSDDGGDIDADVGEPSDQGAQASAESPRGQASIQVDETDVPVVGAVETGCSLAQELELQEQPGMAGTEPTATIARSWLAEQANIARQTSEDLVATAQTRGAGSHVRAKQGTSRSENHGVKKKILPAASSSSAVRVLHCSLQLDQAAAIVQPRQRGPPTTVSSPYVWVAMASGERKASDVVLFWCVPRRRREETVAAFIVERQAEGPSSQGSEWFEVGLCACSKRQAN